MTARDIFVLDFLVEKAQRNPSVNSLDFNELASQHTS